MKYLGNKKAKYTVFAFVIVVGFIILQQWSSYDNAMKQQNAAGKSTVVYVSKPEVKEVYSRSESTGRIQAKYTVDVLARINGWLQTRYFSEGAKVKKGQTLFLIEPDQYQIAVNNASATVRQTLANLTNAEKELVRANELVKKDYVSKSYYDQALATRDSAQAAYDAAKAQLSNAKLNLSYTKVTSPIDGKIGKILITEGNLVNTQSGPLARIVSVSPIYAYFTVKSANYISMKQEHSSLDNMKVELMLANGTMYDEEGKVEFINNEVDQTTGTISLRASFENKDDVLVPGDFVKVIITSKVPTTEILVPQSATLRDADSYYVWSYNENNQAVRKNIKVGNEIDKKWIVLDGLTPEDNIVALGIQSIRMPGQPIEPKPLEETKETTQEAK